MLITRVRWPGLHPFLEHHDEVLRGALIGVATALMMLELFQFEDIRAAFMS